MLNEVLKERGDNYGSFHTFANLSQTLYRIIMQHYNSTHVNENNEVAQMPHFMAEALHMICHKISRIANGNPYYDDSWQDIAGYATLVANILQEAKAAQEATISKEEADTNIEDAQEA